MISSIPGSITRYDDVVACLKDPRMYVVEECKRVDALPARSRPSSRRCGASSPNGAAGRSRSDHDVFLRVVKKYFTPRRMAGRVGTIQRLMDGLVEAALGHGGRLTW